MRRLLVALVAFVGCGDNVTGTPYELFDAEAVEAQCDYFARCGLFTDRAACDGFFRAHHDLGRTAAIADGTVFYNGHAAAQCHAAMAAMSCDLSSREGRNQPEVCGRVFFGTRAEGDACFFDSECLSGECSTPPSCSPDTCCGGTCLPERAKSSADGPCEFRADCVGDAFCGTDSLCHPLAKAAAECQRDEDCDYGLGCIGRNEFMPGNCRELPKIGESCPYLRCAEINARCDESSHMCVALGLPQTACVSDADCSPHAECDLAAKTCRDLPRVGMDCTARCGGFSFCNVLTNKCIPPLPNGIECSGNDQCQSLYCHVDITDVDFCADPATCF